MCDVVCADSAQDELKRRYTAGKRKGLAARLTLSCIRRPYHSTPADFRSSHQLRKRIRARAATCVAIRVGNSRAAPRVVPACATVARSRDCRVWIGGLIR